METATSVSSDSPWFWTVTSNVIRSATGTRFTPLSVSSVPDGCAVAPWRPVPWSPGAAAWSDPPEIRPSRVSTVSGSSQPRSGRNRSVGNRSSMPLFVIGGRQLGDRALEVDHVTGQECLHLARDRVDRVPAVPLVAECRRQLLGDAPDRIRAKLERLDQPAVRVVQLVGMIGAARPRDQLLGLRALCVHLGLDVERVRAAGPGQEGEQPVRDLTRAAHQGTHVRGVVLERALLASCPGSR